MTQLYLNKFKLYQQEAQEESPRMIDVQDSRFNDKSGQDYGNFEDVTSLVLGIGVVASGACAMLVGRVGVKRLLLLSASLMAASMFFVSLLSHFSQGG